MFKESIYLTVKNILKKLYGGSITKHKIMSDGKLILWKSLKNEWEVNGLKYQFQFLEQY